MPILQLISSNQANSDNKFLGDIQGVFDDDHIFSDRELANYDYLSVATGINTRDEVVIKLNEIDFRYEMAFWDSTAQEWTFVDPMEDDQQSKTVWSDMTNPVTWYDLAVPFGYKFNIQDLTAEEKQLIASIDINHPSVDSALAKLRKEVFNTNPANQVEVTDLKNTTP